MPTPPIHRYLLTIIVVLFWVIGLQSAHAFDDPTPLSRMAAPRISLTFYERIPISALLAHPDRYQMRDVRITGTIVTIQTDTILNRMVCGRAHERTTLTLEDETGQIEVIDLGACGKNVGALKAPMVKAGQRIELLVQMMIPANTGTPGLPVETTIRYIEPVRD